MQGKPRVQLFRHVSKRTLKRRGVKRPEINQVYFENSRMGLKIPLKNQNGMLNGVFEMPNRQILEIRYTGRVFEARINNKLIGFVDDLVKSRWVDTEFRGTGVAHALFDLAEPIKAAIEKPKTKGGVSITAKTSKAGSAIFLAKRRYRGEKPSDNQSILVIQSQKLKNEKLPEKLESEINFKKTVAPARFWDAEKWHRIKVMGKNGKPKWLVLRAIPVTRPVI